MAKGCEAIISQNERVKKIAIVALVVFFLVVQ